MPTDDSKTPPTDTPPPVADGSAHAALAKWHRRVAWLMLLAVAAAVVGFFFTPTGQQCWNHPQAAAELLRRHGAVAPLIFLAAYFLLANLCLPVWWLQIAAGYCFGLWFGILWCETGAVCGAISSMLISRWLLADWFHQRVESRLAKLKRLDDILGHNGFLVVMTCRLMHFIPFGISNYIFGLTGMTVLDVFLGTFLGSIVSIAGETAAGSGVEKNWKLFTILAAINVLLLAPLALRYLFPEWFKKHGIE